ncbi:hypothetical protein LguiB_022879 [Lonicera macranthoides]
MFDQMVKLCGGRGRKVLASLVLVAEALAVKEACHIFTVHSFEQATVFSDSKSVISLSVDLDLPWEVAAIIHDIKFLSSSLRINWPFVMRQGNRVAASRGSLHVLLGLFVPTLLLSCLVSSSAF